MFSRAGRIVSPYRLLLPLCFGVFIAADDMTVGVTLLPDMMADLRVGVSELVRASWAITGLLIGFTAAMPLTGRISDRAGYRLAFLAALGVFTLGSALVAMSPQIPGWLFGGPPEFNWLVGMRVFQAIGGGAIIPISIAAVNELVDSRHRAIAYGLIGASAEAALITRGLVELQALCVSLGGAKPTVLGLSGLGDLILTCSNTRSRNFCFGAALGQGQKIADALAQLGAVAEGYSTAKSLPQLIARPNLELPICQAVYHVLYESLAPDTALNNLINRPGGKIE